jgi:hypothetical protein
MASLCAVVMRGGKNPRAVEVISRMAAELGAAVPIPSAPDPVSRMASV